MSLLRSDKEYINNLERILTKINLYFGSVIFVFGFIGNILNILIFSQRSLRSNSCIRIFIAASITGLISIISGLFFQILSNWNVNISDNYQWICKVRTFVIFSSRSSTYWLIMLATIDRWIVSSPNIRFRQLNTNKNVFIGIFMMILFSMIIYFETFYCYVIDSPLNQFQCLNKDQICRLINDFIFAILTVLIPLLLILIFGLMTISNIRSSRFRVESSIIDHPSQVIPNIRHRRNDKKEQSLLIMLFIQVILLSLLTLPMAIQRFYSTARINIQRSELQRMIDRYFYQISLLMTFLATGMQFYVNTLSGGHVFRKALFDFFRLILQKLTCRYKF